MKLLLYLKTLGIALALCGCAAGSGRVVPAAFLGGQGLGHVQEYRIQRGDLLDIKFFYNPELNDQVIVRPDGRISLQLAKEVLADGLTPAQLTESLSSIYATQLRNPEITIIVRSFSAQRVYVDGEVNKAGMVALTDPMTVLQAISQAGGLKETAEPSKVLIIRKSDSNKYVTARVNLNEAMSGKRLENDVMVMPNDIVLVPRSGIANLDLWVDQYIRRLIPVPIGLGLGY